MTGHDLFTCPWRGFSDPVCGAVLDAVRAVGDGPLTALVDSGYPGYVVEGVHTYRSVVSAIQANDMELARKKAASRAASRG